MLDQYFLMMRKVFPQPAEQEFFAVTLSELADVFHCTGRNVNLILRKMEELNWIEWNPGRGRGNRSQLAFQIPAEELVMQSAKELVQKGDIREAFGRLDEYAHIPFLKEKFMQWLDTHFGFRPEVSNRKTIDTLRFPYSKPVHCLDPIGMVYVVESHLIKHFFDTLIRFDTKSG
jgi:SgrR family transcriptional regulator